MTAKVTWPKGFCQECGKHPDDRPSIFKGLDYCSIECAKALGEMT